MEFEKIRKYFIVSSSLIFIISALTILTTTPIQKPDPEVPEVPDNVVSDPNESSNDNDQTLNETPSETPNETDNETINETTTEDEPKFQVSLGQGFSETKYLGQDDNLGFSITWTNRSPTDFTSTWFVDSKELDGNTFEYTEKKEYNITLTVSVNGTTVTKNTTVTPQERDLSITVKSDKYGTDIVNESRKARVSGSSETFVVETSYTADFDYNWTFVNEQKDSNPDYQDPQVDIDGNVARVDYVTEGVYTVKVVVTDGYYTEEASYEIVVAPPG